jgi:magnesium chelatase family protein
MQVMYIFKNGVLQRNQPPKKECVCGLGVVKQYVSKISGLLFDRIELHVGVTLVSYDELTTTKRHKLNSRDIRARVLMAREL